MFADEYCIGKGSAATAPTEAPAVLKANKKNKKSSTKQDISIQTSMMQQQQQQLAKKLEQALSTPICNDNNEDAIKCKNETNTAKVIEKLQISNDDDDDNNANNKSLNMSVNQNVKDDDSMREEDVFGRHDSISSVDDKHDDDNLDAKGMLPHSPTMQIKIPDYTAYMPVTRDAIEYNMQHKNRGWALIFNHEDFDVPTLTSRKGTNKDSADLKKSLEKLHFHVEEHKNKKYIEIQSIISKISELDHSNSDCILIAILSHGDHGHIYAKDFAYKLDSISHYFTAHHCPSLAGKPKLFFIQACQGDRFDPGIELKKREKTETDGASTTASYKIPTHADFLFAFSTIPGFYSWRNPENGSWFIQSLVHELNENALQYDILSLLTFVNRRVALDFESNVRGQPIMDQQKQTPCLTSMLTRILRFNDKNVAKDKKGQI